MSWEYTIWLAMYVNGVEIGMVTILEDRKLIQRGHLSVHIVYFVEVIGAFREMAVIIHGEREIIHPA